MAPPALRTRRSIPWATTTGTSRSCAATTSGKHEGKITGLAAYGEESLPGDPRAVHHATENGTMVNVGNAFRHAALQTSCAPH